MATRSDLPAARLRSALGHFATGVSVVTARDGDDRPVGTTVSALASLSLDPPLVLVCLGRASTTLAAVRDRGAFAINLLADGQEGLAAHFARSGAAAGWEDVAHETGVTGSPRLAGALTVLDCEVHDHLDGGDHEIVLGRPVDLAVAVDRQPLLHYRGTFGALAA